MKRLVACAGLVTATTAHAEPRDLFPLQVDVGVEVAVGSGMWTSGGYFSLAYVRTLADVGRGWHLFGGIGFGDDIVGSWQRDGRRAPDAISAQHSPGVEARIGIVHGTQLGAPRIAITVTPMWATGVTEMTLPGDRGFGVRTAVGFAWPAWLLGNIDPDPPGTKSYDQTEPLKLAFAALVPSKIEYVFMHVPGDNRHGFALGWSF